MVNVTSVHERTPIADDGAYAAAKHGLGGLTKQLALELGRDGITVNSVAGDGRPLDDRRVDPRRRRVMLATRRHGRRRRTSAAA